VGFHVSILQISELWYEVVSVVLLFGCGRQQKRHTAAPPPAVMRRRMETGRNWWVRIRAV